MRRTRGRPIRYPWPKWLTPEKRSLLKKGRDYDCQPHSMAQQIRNAAAKRDVVVSIHIDGEVISISCEACSRKDR
jgi:hypothetical protein